MAWWGATSSQEDDAERAVRSALEVVDAVASLGERLGVAGLAARSGVMTGEVAVGPGGNEKGLLLGDLVNTTSRLQSLAEPGTVFIGDVTASLVNRAIDLEPAGTHQVKGKEEPVVAWKATRVLSERGGRGRVDMLEPPFVGRASELRLLKDTLIGTGRDRTGPSRVAHRSGRHRQEQADPGVLQLRRWSGRRRLLARGSFAVVWGRSGSVGARRDDPGPGRDPGDRFARGHRRTARRVCRCLRPRRRGRLGARAAGRSAGRRRVGGRRTHRTVRGRSHLLRGHRRRRHHRAGLRRPPLGRSQPARIRRGTPRLVPQPPDHGGHDGPP